MGTNAPFVVQRRALDRYTMSVTKYEAIRILPNMCWGVLEANQAIGSTYLLEADWVTISTNL